MTHTDTNSAYSNEVWEVQLTTAEKPRRVIESWRVIGRDNVRRVAAAVALPLQLAPDVRSANAAAERVQCKYVGLV